ncbi:septum site-determining protein Ssd [Arthrobacter sp. Soil763]|uniref:septum site-determining protein Ssd n=1 Tax=Arthrobacter sp. Soil763 TaxID=1736402 RepID=UPI0009E92106|nr:septum site-determining protein Ssd [Arthrobacter sp. Soil763]
MSRHQLPQPDPSRTENTQSAPPRRRAAERDRPDTEPRYGGPQPGAPVRAGPWLPADAAGTLLVTRSAVLRSEVERIAAAAGRQLLVVPDAAAAAPHWDSAGTVLVGSDVAELPPRRSAPAVLVGLDDDGLWPLAAAMGADRVAVLPDAGAWLAEYLTRSQAPDPGGHVLGVIGGCGGAGATTAAVWLAQAAAGLGARVLLVDGDPWGGGLELALAAEEEPGLRWPDLAGASGSIDPDQLQQALPEAGGFSFLSWPGSREPAPAIDDATTAGVLDAARRSYELVVVDIGRGLDAVRSFAWECDRLVVVVPAQLRAAVAAARLVAELPPADTVLVLRAKPGATVGHELVAQAVRLPVQGIVPEIRGTAAATELGRLLDTGARRSVHRFATALFDVDAAGPP